MDAERFTQIMCSPFTENGRAETGEMIFLTKLTEDRRGSAFEVAMMRKRGAALGNIDGPQFPRPVVEIAE